jgi:hypothetical protein
MIHAQTQQTDTARLDGRASIQVGVIWRGRLRISHDGVAGHLGLRSGVVSLQSTAAEQ